MSFRPHYRKSGFRSRPAYGPNFARVSDPKFKSSKDAGFSDDLFQYVLNYKGTHPIMLSIQKQLPNWGLTRKQWQVAENNRKHSIQTNATPATPIVPITLAHPIPIFINRTAAFREIRDPYKLPYGIFALKIKSISNAGKARNGNVWAELEVEADADSPVSACRICGKTLRDHRSVVSGIGPDCARKLGALYVTYKQDVQKFVNDFKAEAAKVGTMKIKLWKNQVKENVAGLQTAVDMFMAAHPNRRGQIRSIQNNLPAGNVKAIVNQVSPVSLPQIKQDSRFPTCMWDGKTYPMRKVKMSTMPQDGECYVLSEERIFGYSAGMARFKLRNDETRNVVEFYQLVGSTVPHAYYGHTPSGKRIYLIVEEQDLPF